METCVHVPAGEVRDDRSTHTLHAHGTDIRLSNPAREASAAAARRLQDAR